MDLGSGEFVLILILALLVYGGELPKVARGIGRFVGSIKRALAEGSSDVRQALDVEGAVDATLRGTPPREVRRAIPADRPAPQDVATEDVSGEPAPPAEARPGESGTGPADRGSSG